MNNEFSRRVPPDQEKPGDTFLKVGENITIGDKKHVIERVSAARDLGAEFGLDISDDVPIYWLSDSGSRRKGAFVPEKNIILFFENTDKETQHHELTHVVEFFQEKRPNLLALYKRVKAAISEDSFEGGFISFNFRKNIHEFIADGRTKSAFIDALKKEGLYDDFVNETTYLFETLLN
jgi:hypothetical protein